MLWRIASRSSRCSPPFLGPYYVSRPNIWYLRPSQRRATARMLTARQPRCTTRTPLHGGGMTLQPTGFTDGGADECNGSWHVVSSSWSRHDHARHQPRAFQLTHYDGTAADGDYGITDLMVACWQFFTTLLVLVLAARAVERAVDKRVHSVWQPALTAMAKPRPAVCATGRTTAASTVEQPCCLTLAEQWRQRYGPLFRLFYLRSFPCATAQNRVVRREEGRIKP